ncbi:unnamed protein product [Lampetra planeri]
MPNSPPPAPVPRPPPASSEPSTLHARDDINVHQAWREPREPGQFRHCSRGPSTVAVFIAARSPHRRRRSMLNQPLPPSISHDGRCLCRQQRQLSHDRAADAVWRPPLPALPTPHPYGATPVVSPVKPTTTTTKFVAASRTPHVQLTT